MEFVGDGINETRSSVIFLKDREGDTNLRHMFGLVNRKAVIFFIMTKSLHKRFYYN
jgi:hypothetical protein